MISRTKVASPGVTRECTVMHTCIHTRAQKTYSYSPMKQGIQNKAISPHPHPIPAPPTVVEAVGDLLVKTEEQH